MAKRKVYPNSLEERRGWRDGYPSLFCGKGSATSALTRIFCLEPASAAQLIEFPGKPPSATDNGVLLKVMADGFVSYYIDESVPLSKRRFNRPRRLYCLNRIDGIGPEIRATLQSIAMSVGLSSYEARSVANDVPMLPGQQAVNLSNLFGTPNRTTTIVLLAIDDYLDASTISRVVGVRPDGDSIALLKPLVDGRVIKRIRCGKLMLYSLADELWSSPLRQLCIRIAEIEPRYYALAAVAKQLRDSENNHRVHLRNFVGRRF